MCRVGARRLALLGRVREGWLAGWLAGWCLLLPSTLLLLTAPLLARTQLVLGAKSACTNYSSCRKPAVAAQTARCWLVPVSGFDCD